MKSSLPVFAVTLVAAFALGDARARAAEDAKALADAVRQAPLPPDKRAAAKKLAALGADASRAELLKLFEDDSDSWTPQAAELALITLEDDQADTALARHLERGVPEDDEIVAALAARKKPFPAAPLIARLESEPDAREAIVGALGAVGGPAARDALAGLVRSQAKETEPLRGKALGALAKAGKPAEIRPFALEFLPDADPTVAGGALALLIEGGTAADLPRVLATLRSHPAEADAPVAVVAYRGVAKWGDAKTKLETFLGALRDKDERRAQAAIDVFSDVGGVDVEGELCRLVRRATQQETRLGAADRLVAWPAAAPGEPDRIVPYLITALKETDEPPAEPTGFFSSLLRELANIITLGATNLFDAWNRHKTREAVAASVTKVGEALEKRTGAHPGKTHAAWVDWGVERGMTIEGDNVVARIFSGYPEVRRKAEEAGARMLGFAGREDFVAKNAGLAGAKGHEVGIEMARRLVAKGMPVDETR